MESKRQKRKKTTIYRMFLIPLIAIMLVQSMITIGTLVARRITGTLQEYSGSMMSRLVENRKVILQNDMNQRWATIHEQESTMTKALEDFLDRESMELDAFLASAEQKNRFLEQIFPECLEMLHNSSTTGIFFLFTGEEWETACEHEGFFVRDSDPAKNPANYSDLLLERGSKNLSRQWNIPLDTNWTTKFHMGGEGNDGTELSFYEPWRAGREHADVNTKDLGYWALPFSLEKGTAGSYEMITYSLPLRYEGSVYGVLGVEISAKVLRGYLPAEELNDSRQSGYMLAVKEADGSYRPLLGEGLLSNTVKSAGDTFSLRETAYSSLSEVLSVKQNGQGIYGVACPLKLYSNNVPYDHTEWVLLGLDTEEDLFGMSRRLYLWMVVAILFGLGFGVLGIYFLVRYLTKPVGLLMQCISRGSAGLLEYRPSNIFEIDALYDVVKDLTNRQKEAENILLEEKERYRVALESSNDIFFSYDFESRVLDLVNHKTMSGRWQCEACWDSFIEPDDIYETDRADTIAAIQEHADKLSVEFRLRWPKDGDFKWVAVTGNAVYDTDGKKRKLIGSIRDIQAQKEKEARQLRENETDGVTGLYIFSAGMKYVAQCRSAMPEGVMVNLFFDGIRESGTKCGIVFSDMILEEIGCRIESSCEKFRAETGSEPVRFRLNTDEFVLWLGGCTKEAAERLVKELSADITACFGSELFGVDTYAGLACAEARQDTEELIRRAKLARRIAVADDKERDIFYGDIPADKRTALPAMQGRDIRSAGYGEDIGLVSVALNLFSKGGGFAAQMMLMIRKIGRFYQAQGVLVSLLRADFNSNYVSAQWHGDGHVCAETVRKYKEEEKEAFYQWLGQREVRYVSEEDSREEVLRCFLGIEDGDSGVVLPMYDSGNYMGNICILGIAPDFLEDSEQYQDLAELGRVVESQLNQQQHDIASKAKSEFLSRMSHEIRTPMNGIIGMAAIALQQEQSRERILDCLQKIQSSSKYLLGLINDILDMSKIESGKMKLEPCDFSMHEMLDTIGELIAPQAAAKQIDFVKEIRISHNCFSADRMRISQVLINLLGNAVKFTPERGRVALSVEELENSGSWARVSFAVSDTGIGIAKEDQERVFRSFEQASSNPSKQQGTGLGLSISSRLVQMMGSNIQIESEPGAGSTFRFTIPIDFGEDMETEVFKEEVSFEGYRVLVVEDNELNAEIAQCLLEERGFEVDCAYNGAEAVERIKGTQPGTYDVILMDIMMPVMDGLEATRAIRAMEREDCHTIPIVAMSANAFDDDLKKSVECGMNGHLSKPVDVEKLYQTLEEIVLRK
ncbi:MAG: response regulator [Lachnospiraceae bacterium]|nr:response regulator [Lachnospiraceae bacterium]